jgi:hypothetical protein
VQYWSVRANPKKHILDAPPDRIEFQLISHRTTADCHGNRNSSTSVDTRFCLAGCAGRNDVRVPIAHRVCRGKAFSRSHTAVIRVYDDAGSVIETHEQAGDFKQW